MATTNYETHLKEYAQLLHSMGYSTGSQKMLTAYSKEFLRHIEQLGIAEATQIQPEHIRQHYEHLEQRPNRRRSGGLSAMSLMHHVYAVRLLMSYLQETGQLEKNPMSGMIFPKAAFSAREVLSQEQIKTLYEKAETYRERTLLGLLYGCGLRKSEAEKLNTGDVDFAHGLLYVRYGKGKKRRVIPLTEKVTEDLRNYFLCEREQHITRHTTEGTSHSNAFLLNNHGRRMLGWSYRWFLNGMLKRAGIDKAVCLHTFRHSIATHLLENGTSVEYVRQFLGHALLDTTKIYTKVSKKQILSIHEHPAIPSNKIPSTDSNNVPPGD